MAEQQKAQAQAAGTTEEKSLLDQIVTRMSTSGDVE
jgi:hypothetical protein